MSTTTISTIRHRIGGDETPGASTRTAPVWNPATGEQQAEVLLAEREDVDRAVATARTAFETWGNASLSRRARVMFAFRELVDPPHRRPRADRRLRARQGVRRRARAR